VHNATVLDTGEKVSEELVRKVIGEVRGELSEVIPAEFLDPAIELFEQVALAEHFADFLTLPAYDRIK
jgi:malate synthase